MHVVLVIRGLMIIGGLLATTLVIDEVEEVISPNDGGGSLFSTAMLVAGLFAIYQILKRRG